MFINIGCSGRHYDHWQGAFYPENLPKAELFPYYARTFQTVEINNTFYQLPAKETLQDWYHSAPSGFIYTLKGNRYITHMKKLKEAPEPLANFYDHAAILGEKIGCILWQLPPNFHFNEQRLEQFCQSLAKNFRNVLEFRHESWFCDEAWAILEKHGIGFAIISSPDLPEIPETTSSFAYIRFHGKTPGNRYQYHYSEAELEAWGKRIRQFPVNEVFAYFNNDYQGYAPKNALKLREILVNN